jgi:hypothetical protein
VLLCISFGGAGAVDLAGGETVEAEGNVCHNELVTSKYTSICDSMNQEHPRMQHGTNPRISAVAWSSEARWSLACASASWSWARAATRTFSFSLSF